MAISSTSFKKGHKGYNSWLGRHHTEETKRKISLAHKGKKLSEEHKRKIVAKLIGRPVSEETRKKIGDANRGEKCGNWKGDAVKYRALHSRIIREWGKANICSNCESTKNVEWHNISGKYKLDREDWEKLCRKCHMDKDERIKRRKKWWI